MPKNTDNKTVTKEVETPIMKNTEQLDKIRTLTEALTASRAIIDQLKVQVDELTDENNKFNELFDESIKTIDDLEKQVKDVQSEKNKSDDELKKVKSNLESEQVSEAIMSAHALKNEIISKANIDAEKIISDAHKDATVEAESIIKTAKTKADNEAKRFDDANAKLVETVTELNSLKFGIENLLSKEVVTEVKLDKKESPKESVNKKDIKQFEKIEKKESDKKIITSDKKDSTKNNWGEIKIPEKKTNNKSFTKLEERLRKK